MERKTTTLFILNIRKEEPINIRKEKPLNIRKEEPSNSFQINIPAVTPAARIEAYRQRLQEKLKMHNPSFIEARQNNCDKIEQTATSSGENIKLVINKKPPMTPAEKMKAYRNRLREKQVMQNSSIPDKQQTTSENNKSSDNQSSTSTIDIVGNNKKLPMTAAEKMRAYRLRLREKLMQNSSIVEKQQDNISSDKDGVFTNIPSDKQSCTPEAESITPLVSNQQTCSRLPEVTCKEGSGDTVMDIDSHVTVEPGLEETSKKSDNLCQNIEEIDGHVTVEPELQTSKKRDNLCQNTEEIDKHVTVKPGLETSTKCDNFCQNMEQINNHIKVEPGLEETPTKYDNFDKNIEEINNHIKVEPELEETSTKCDNLNKSIEEINNHIKVEPELEEASAKCDNFDKNIEEPKMYYIKIEPEDFLLQTAENEHFQQEEMVPLCPDENVNPSHNENLDKKMETTIKRKRGRSRNLSKKLHKIHTELLRQAARRRKRKCLFQRKILLNSEHMKIHPDTSWQAAIQNIHQSCEIMDRRYKEIILNVYNFTRRESTNKELMIPIENFLERTLNATGITKNTLEKIVNEEYCASGHIS